MIVGLGTDIIEIKRIEKAISNDEFLNKYFTTDELELYGSRKSNASVIAGNFAVKEAVAKVFGTGFRGFSLVEIEVLRDELGKPFINLYGNALKKQKELNISKFHVSISNTNELAMATVIGEAL